MNHQRGRSANSCEATTAGHSLRRMVAAALSGIVVSGCDGPQSALHPAGRAAEDIANLFVWMTAGGTAIWVIVIGLAVYAIRSSKAHNAKWTGRLVIIGGAIVPTIVLTVLLCFGLALLPELQQPAPDGSLTIHIQGERFWWRVRYPDRDSAPGPSSGSGFETSNEIRLPVDEPVEFKLTTADVIHSFWIPSIGGKMDMMPGRQTRLKLHPTRRGTFRGVCAEYCGTAHAEMNFDVIVTSRAEFDEWISVQRQTADSPADEITERGHTVFELRGCGACHTIRGTSFDGRVGPDLTHVGSRKTLGAGVLDNDVDGFERWIRDTHDVKPGATMPPFETLDPSDLKALAIYLESLQ